MSIGMNDGSAEKALFYAPTTPDWLATSNTKSEIVSTALALWLIQEFSHNIDSFQYPDSARLKALANQALRIFLIKNLIERGKNWV